MGGMYRELKGQIQSKSTCMDFKGKDIWKFQVTLKLEARLVLGQVTTKIILKNTLNPLVGGENMAVTEVHVWVTFYLIICSSSIFLTLLAQKLYSFSSEEQIILKVQVRVSNIPILIFFAELTTILFSKILPLLQGPAYMLSQGPSGWKQARSFFCTSKISFFGTLSLLSMYL